MNGIKNYLRIRKNSIIFTIVIILLFTIPSILVVSNEQGVVWDAVINVEAPASNDWVIIGEDPSSNDGPPYDINDVNKAPVPPSGIYMYCDDNLGGTYSKLYGDYRYYPDTTKTWNLTVEYSIGTAHPDPTVTVNMTWNISDFEDSEYSFVNLTDWSGTFIIDMLSQNYYVFSITDPGPGVGFEQFKIICEGGRSSGDDDDDSSGGDDDDDSSGGDDDDDYIPPVNQPPVADASASDTFGVVGTVLAFNGSLSSDPDGYITSWLWDFGDGASKSGEITTHYYSENGTYLVRLTVKDDNGGTDNDTFYVVIGVANNPPLTPIVNGVTSGSAYTYYNYSVMSTDLDNNSLSYKFDWGDGAINTSDFLPNGTKYTIKHAWTEAGVYIVNVTVSDGMAISKKVNIVVLIDAEYVLDLGYLFDIDRDGVYDFFYSNNSGTETAVDLNENGVYLLDINEDGKWDYFYDSISGTLSSYEIKDMSSVVSWI